jgi:murein L,D-transpeptidase YcbB/YkuD
MLIRLVFLFALVSSCSARDVSATVMPENSEAISEAAIAAPPASVAGSSDLAYARLQEAIETYQGIAARGGWTALSSGEMLEIGSHGPRVAALRQRLSATADLTDAPAQPEQFDLQLDVAVRRFQARHGLEPDGIVGSQTLAALNVPIEHRLASMSINLSRMLAEKRDWGTRYIVVNVAAASYSLIENGQRIVEGPSVVGRPDWSTPRIDSVIDRIEFHPYWTIPTRIAALEVWPKAKRDPSYLRRNHMRIVNGQIRQDPGLDNPLGRVKFVFPNSYSVYLHDTNQPELFAQARRFRSHGCVRISEALNLARMLLRDDVAWPAARIDAAIAGGQNIRVPLVRPIPVHLIYDTAWVDDQGVIQFRDDAYGLDRVDLQRTVASFPHHRNVLSAVGYGEDQVATLRRTIEQSAAERVVARTPTELAAPVKVDEPMVPVRDQYVEGGEPFPRVSHRRFPATLMLLGR